MTRKVCPPDYTAEECARCRTDDYRCWSNEVPEPDVLGLLTAALVAALVVKKLRRKP